MTYYLGIDLGTTYTAAAVWRSGRVEIASLGTRAPVVPSVVLLREDGTFLIGEAAARRAVTEPQRIAREFKRRFGDPTPIMIGTTPYSADALTARLMRWVVDSVAEREGERPSGIVVAHPANWGPYKQDLLRQVFRLADLTDVTTISEPEAAAIHYASQERVEPGWVVAIYDLGGGTFDAAVLRRTGDGWEILGEPEGVERLGGVDFDQAVYHHVMTAIGDAVDSLDDDDQAALAAVSRLRQDCVDAKEALASDVDVTIPVLLPSLQTEVRLTRGEFESMVRPALGDSIGALRRALTSAGVEPADVHAVLLVGGSSRLPLVAQLVGSELGRPVAVDAHPKHGVALGAAITAAERAQGRSVNTEVVPTIEVIETTTSPAGAGAGYGAASPPGGIGPAGAVVAGAAGGALAGAALGAPGAAAASPPPSPPSPPSSPPAESPPTVPVLPMTPPAGGPPLPPTLASSQGPPPRSRPPEPRNAGSGSGSGNGGGKRTSGRSRPSPALAIGGGILAAALLVVAGIALTRGGDDDGGQASTAGTEDTGSTTDATDSTTTTAESTTTSTAIEAPQVRLTGVEVTEQPNGDKRYLVRYTWGGFEPNIDEGNRDALHFHFFLDTTKPENAGVNGHPPGDWDLTDNQGEFVTKYDPADIGGARQMCTLVANGLHEVYDANSGNCMPLPN